MWSTTVSPPVPSGLGSHGAAHHVRNICPGRAAFPGSLRELQTVQQRSELLPLGRVDHVVGIQPEGIIAGGVFQGRVAGGGEIIDPDEVEHPRPEFARDLLGPVGAAGIDHDDLVEKSRAPTQAMRQIFLLVSDDHGQTDPAAAADRSSECLAADRRG